MRRVVGVIGFWGSCLETLIILVILMLITLMRYSYSSLDVIYSF